MHHFCIFWYNVWLIRYKEGEEDVFEKWLSLTITGVGGLFLRLLFGFCLRIDEVNNYLRGRSLARARERRPRRCWSLEGGTGPWSRTCSCLAWSFGQVGTVVKMSPGYSGPVPLPLPLSLNTVHFFFSFDSGGFFWILFFWLPLLAGIRTWA